MYLLGFYATYLLGCYRAKGTNSVIAREKVSDIIFYGALGVILGGRIGYILFYNFVDFIHQPFIFFQIWNGGMSFHGGLIGVLLAVSCYGLYHKIHVVDILDFFAPMVPIGLGAGRLGNFINDELWGRVTDSSVGMVFPSGGPLPRYPITAYRNVFRRFRFVFYIMVFIDKAKAPWCNFSELSNMVWYFQNNKRVF